MCKSDGEATFDMPGGALDTTNPLSAKHFRVQRIAALETAWHRQSNLISHTLTKF